MAWDADAYRDRGSEDPWNKNKCNRRNPSTGSECCREPGHPEEIYGWPTASKHVSYDSDHYEEWLVGKRGTSYYIPEVMEVLEEIAKNATQFSTLRELGIKAGQLHASLKFEGN